MNSTFLDRRADSLPIGNPALDTTQMTRTMARWQGSELAKQIAIVALLIAFSVYLTAAGWSQGSLAQGLMGAAGFTVATGGFVAYSRRRARSLPYPTNSLSLALEKALDEVDHIFGTARSIAERRNRLQDLVPAVNEAFASFLGRPCATFPDTPLRHDSEHVVPVERQYREDLQRLSWLNRPRTVRHDVATTIGVDCLTSYRRVMRNLGVNIDLLEPYDVPSSARRALPSPTTSVAATITPIYLAGLGARLGEAANRILPPLRQKLNRCLAVYPHMSDADRNELDAIINRHLPAIETAFVDKTEQGTAAIGATDATVQAIGRIDATLDDLLARGAKGADDAFSTVIGFLEARHPAR
jgi:hypothetical protein